MQDTKISSLNKQAYVAASNPAIFQRIEECVLNAKTSLAKRRLVRAAVVLGGCLYL
jgi:hypothetical protein